MSDAAIQPILVDPVAAAKLLDVSRAQLFAMDAAGLIPAPVRPSPRVVKFVVAELQEWARSGCPPRQAWEQLKRDQRAKRK